MVIASVCDSVVSFIVVFRGSSCATAAILFSGSPLVDAVSTRSVVCAMVTGGVSLKGTLFPLTSVVTSSVFLGISGASATGVSGKLDVCIGCCDACTIERFISRVGF